MKAWETLEAMLATDPRDASCAETFELIQVYAQIVLDGGDPEAEMPGLTVHLATCGPCTQDYLGLLAAMRHEASQDEAGQDETPEGP